MPQDWTKDLRPVLAMKNIRIDVTNDWYRDPWAWPEYDFLLSGHLDWLTRRARASGIRYATNIDVPKENFGIRPAIIMEPLDRLLYQSLVDAASLKLIGSLPDWVYGWRLRRTRTRAGVYAPQAREWAKYRKYLKEASLLFDCGMKTDIVSCFASIPIERLCEEIEQRARINGVTRRLTDMLLAFNRIPGRTGLPQRSMASSTLANMYLERLNDVVGNYTVTAAPPRLAELVGGDLAVRWMDDFWAFGDDQALLRSLQVDLQSIARSSGIELNLGKTDVYVDEDLWSTVAKIEHSAIDAAIELNPPDVEPLEHLIEQLVDSPEKADRTSIRFAMTRMRRQKLRGKLDDILTATPRMPHGADHLARAFRDFRVWRSRADWFLEYANSAWGEIGWSLAQIGTMFPTRIRPSRAVRQRFEEFMTTRTSFPLFALSAQRLSSWDPDHTRSLLRDLVDLIDSPQERRIVGLAAATLGEEAQFIRHVLGEYEENQLTLSLLEDRGFESIDPAPDFTPDSS